MFAEVQFSQARRDFSALYDTVYHGLKPALVRRRSEEVLLVREDLVKELLKDFVLKPEVLEEEDGSVTLALDEMDLAVNGPTLEEALEELAQEIKLYCQDYLDRPQLFLNAPNRRPHFPYVLRVALCDSDEEIKALLELPCRQGSGS
ncbi:MAG: exoribonuclease R [Clostridia bacterium]|nr:MAG: exoribonuclease R [Clostridia bacterium]